jgi:uncharacterized protein YbjT (DUF2867 family)
MSGRVLVAGASGFVGRRLVDHLTAAGVDVVCGTRSVASARARDPRRRWVVFDVDRDEGLREALTGVRALVYLVHQMGTGDHADLHDREVAAAKRVSQAVDAAGVQRIVYLGAPAPQAGNLSHHLRARLDTGEQLRAGQSSCIELRASMIVGAGSESWTICRDLALRLPMMLLPRWLATRSQPIGIDDVVRALAAAIDDPLPASAAFDLPGPEALSARQILERVAALQGIRPLMIPVPVLTPSLSSHWLRLVTRADYGIARQLVDGLTSDLVSEGPGYWARMGGARPEPFDVAARRALAEDAAALPLAAVRFERFVSLVARRA